MNRIVEIDYVEGEALDRIEFKGTVTLKRLNFSEKNSLDEETNDIKMIGNMPQMKISISKIKEIGLLKSIIGNTLVKTTYYQDRTTKAHVPTANPYDLGLEGIRNLPMDVGEQLFSAFTELNTLSEKKNVS